MLKILVAKSALALGLRLGAALVSFLLAYFISKQFGADQAGQYFFLVSTLMFLSSVCLLGMQNVIVKMVAQNASLDGCKRSFFLTVTRWVLVSSLSLSVLVAVAGELELGNAVFISVAPHAAVSLFGFSMMFVLSSFFQGDGRVVASLVILNFAYQAVLLFSIFIFGLNQLSALFNGVAIAVYIVGCVSSIYLLVCWPESKAGAPAFATVWASSRPLFLAQFISQAALYLNQFLMGNNGGAVDIGLFGVAARVAIVLNFVSFAINKVFSSKFAHYFAQNEMSMVRKLVAVSVVISCSVSVPFFVCMVVWGESLLALFGEDFVAGYSILLVISCGQFVASSCGVFPMLLQMIGREKYFFRASLVASVLAVFFSIVFVPLYGGLGAAMAYAVSLVTTTFLAVYLAFEDLKGTRNAV